MVTFTGVDAPDQLKTSALRTERRDRITVGKASWSHRSALTYRSGRRTEIRRPRTRRVHGIPRPTGQRRLFRPPGWPASAAGLIGAEAPHVAFVVLGYEVPGAVVLVGRCHQDFGASGSGSFVHAVDFVEGDVD